MRHGRLFTYTIVLLLTFSCPGAPGMLFGADELQGVEGTVGTGKPDRPVTVSLIPGDSYGVSPEQASDWLEGILNAIETHPGLEHVDRDAGIDVKKAGSYAKADYFLRGTISRVGKIFYPSLELITVDEGEIVAMRRQRVPLPEEYESQAMELLSDLLTGERLREDDEQGVLSLTSNPAGAFFFLDGDYIGRTPLQKELPAGRFRGMLVAEGRKNYLSFFTLQPGETHKVAVAMEPGESSLRRDFDYTDYLYVPGFLLSGFSYLFFAPFPVNDAVMNYSLEDAPRDRYFLPTLGADASYYFSHTLIGVRAGLPLLSNHYNDSFVLGDSASSSMLLELYISPFATLPLKFRDMTFMPSFQLGMQYYLDKTQYHETGETLVVSAVSVLAGGEFYLLFPNKDRSSAPFLKLGAYAGFPISQRMELDGEEQDITDFGTSTGAWDGNSFWWPTGQIVLSGGFSYNDAD